MEVGIVYTKTVVVTKEDTAVYIGSGLLDVYATPAVAALIENCCMNLVSDKLDDGFTTVGTSLNLAHISPTPVGMNVTCECELVNIDGRKLVFNVSVSDENDIIVKGSHERYIVNADKFQSKTDLKLTSKSSL